jgi:hypothetical protein
LIKTWPLLGACGALDAVHAFMNLLMLNPSGSMQLRRFGLPNEVRMMSVLAVAAGACAFAAGVWGYRRAWFLSLHGLALSVFGMIGLSPLVRGPLSFRPISLLFVVMAASLGAFAFGIGRDFAGGERRTLTVAEIMSVCFAASFVAVGLGGTRLRPPEVYWIWMASFYAFCAGFLLWAAFVGFYRAGWRWRAS